MDDSDINISITYNDSDGYDDFFEELSQRHNSTQLQSREKILLDDTVYMYVKYRVAALLATKLVAPLAKPSEHSSQIPSDEVKFEECRRCSGQFVFRLQSGGVVTIVLGIPPNGTDYKAMSYVWGDVTTLRIPCSKCGQVSSVPMLNARRFKNLMDLAGKGNNIWLDVISIDQSNQSEIRESIAAMGRIYTGARCVSVLLPESDATLFENFDSAAGNAIVILSNLRSFVNNSEIEIEDLTGIIPPPGKLKILAEASRVFLGNIKIIHDNIHYFRYWRRAWTFQEWALAKDIEIAVEGGPAKVSYTIKSLLLGAGILLARYKLLYSQYTTIETSLSRSSAPESLRQIKGLIPCEDLFLSYEEVDSGDALFETWFPHLGVNQLLGLRSLPSVLPEPYTDVTSQIRTRLITLLPLFASRKRDAKFEADLVACWAGMCNIEYDYRKEDDFDTALQKVIIVLRSNGIRFYRFLPDTKGGTHPPSDAFRAYAYEHPQSQCAISGTYRGPPIFTGQIDIFLHIGHAVLKTSTPTEFLRSTDGLISVMGASCSDLIPLDDLEYAMDRFANAIYGHIYPEPLGLTMFYPAQNVAMRMLNKIAAQQRAIARLCVICVPFCKDGREAIDTPGLFLWSIVPVDIPFDAMFVSREPTNGTLILATQRDGKHFIVAYLTLTDHLSGTYLVNTDIHGYIDICLKIPRRADLMNSGYTGMGDRHVRGKVPLESRTLS